MNLVVLNGRLTRDPELKYGQSGKAYSRFSVAVDRPFSSEANSSTTADFINCVAFGKTAEFVGEYFRKGKKILLKGNLQMNQYESEGKKITTYVVVVENVEFGETKGNGTSESSPSNSYSTSVSKSKNSQVREEASEVPFEDEGIYSNDETTNPEIDDEFPF